MRVKHTACKLCGQDIEGFAPYRRGEWRDRGNNTHCPNAAGDAGQRHAPVLAERADLIARASRAARFEDGGKG